MVAAYVYVITHVPTSRSYVGASRNPGARFRKHAQVARGKPSPKTQLLHREMRDRLDEFSMQVIESCDSMESAYELEAFFVGYLGTRWPNGFNLESGGRSGSRRHASTVASISAKNSGVPKSLEAIAKRAAAVSGRPLSDEHKVKLSASTKGKPKSEETRAKMRAAMAARWESEEYRRSISSNESARLKKSEAMKRYWADPEYRARVLASRRESLMRGRGEG